METIIKEIIFDIHRIGAVKFGSFPLESGLITPIYIDLRIAISFPPLIKKIGQALRAASEPLAFDLLCGVPYAALPFAMQLSLEHNIPQVFCRKETKNYGTKKQIEGHYRRGQTCLLIEDVTVSGSSLLSTASNLMQNGILVSDALIIIDREQGTKKNLTTAGIEPHSLFTLTDLIEVLRQDGKISDQEYADTAQFLQQHAEKTT